MKETIQARILNLINENSKERMEVTDLMWNTDKPVSLEHCMLAIDGLDRQRQYLYEMISWVDQLDTMGVLDG